MTTQVNLGLVWAATGGSSDPGDTKFESGWLAEIPTYQNFNYVLKAHSINQLVAAEQGSFAWQGDINYVAGVTVLEGGIQYTCVQDHINQQPSTDATNSYWVNGMMLGSSNLSNLQKEYGFYLKDVAPRISASTWDSSDSTISNKSALVQLNTDNVASKNWLFGNVSGNLVAVDIDTTDTADGRSISLSDSKVYKMYHEGNKPAVGDVANAVEEVPNDGVMYARRDGAWVAVTSTAVSVEPPIASVGAGAGWYNLTDGQFYIDIYDGDSSQWVVASPPILPEMFADQTTVNAGSSAALAVTPSTMKGNLDSRGLWDYGKAVFSWNLTDTNKSGMYSSGTPTNSPPPFGASTSWMQTFLKRNTAEWSMIGVNTEGVAAARGAAGGSWGKWRLLTPLVMHVRDEKASGVHGGTNVVGYNIRDLNTVPTNEINGASLLANQITLPAGVYDIFARSPVKKVDDHRASLYNVTDATYDLRGGSGDAVDGNNAAGESIVMGRITITSSKVFELRHYTDNIQANSGLGATISDGGVEVYAEMIITQIAEA